MKQDIDIDIEELAKMIDSAINSDNPSVKSALYSFLTMAALARAEQGDEYISGPFEQLFKRIDQLERIERRLRKVEENQYYNTAYNTADRGSTEYTNKWDAYYKKEWKYNRNYDEDIMKYIGKLDIK